MYAIAVRRTFAAHHFLVGGDWGPENQPHAHTYVVEARLEGANLDRHGYLVDLVEVESHMDALATRFGDRTLNELPEFRELNPSVEHFARIITEALAARMTTAMLTAIEVTVWEHDQAYASYRRTF
jgi:6-pyruvoyltetrahydropterin/6-carboxytetrahydropterin synthase